MPQPQEELPGRDVIERPALIDQLEGRICRSNLSQAEQVVLIRYMNYCWLEQHRTTLIARLREHEPDVEKNAKQQLRRFYNRPGQRMKALVHGISQDLVNASIDRQARQALQAKQHHTTMLAYKLDPQSPHYFRRQENEPDSHLKSVTARGILEMIRAYDWSKEATASARPASTPAP